MKKIFWIIIIIFVIFFGLYFFTRQKDKTFNSIIENTNMKIESSAFANDQMIPPKYTCDGQDVNPPLKISDVPEDAKSLVLIFDDPDSPSGTWVHWTAWNISPQTEEIDEGSTLPGSGEGMTSFGKNGYGGPCPGSGTHHYHFKLYALDTILELGPGSKVEEIEKAMEGHILDSAELVGLYTRM